jgi:DNA repair ATPase RecN
MDENFFEDEIIPRLENKPEIAQVFENNSDSKQSDSLDDLLGASNKKTNLKLLAKSLIQTVISDTGSINTDLEPKYQDIATQVKLATDEIITEAKRDSYLAEPADVLRETRLNIDKITENLGEIAGMSKFDANSFEFELKKVNESVTELVKMAKKYIS